MKIRVFRAPLFEAAQQAVREALGEDALIVETRDTDEGVEILAVVEETLPTRPPSLGAVDPHYRTNDDRLEQRRRALAWHGLSGPLADRLMEDDLPQALTKVIRFDNLPLEDGQRPILLAGEPGAGKSLTMVKLAARLVLAGRPPLVVSADGRKAGAVEQIATLTRLLGLELIVANEARTLRLALSRRPGGAPVLIDGPGLSIRDRDDENELLALGSSVDAELVFVTPIGLDATETAEVAERHATAGASRMIATRLDVGRRLGGIVNASFQAGLSLTEAGVGPEVIGGLEAFTARNVASRLLETPGRRPSPIDKQVLA